MPSHRLALISEVKSVRASELKRVAAALQKQVVRDLAPIWDVTASVEVAKSRKATPKGSWPVVLQEDIAIAGASAVHMDKDGEPFALVLYGPDWGVRASHSMLEMLIDPFGNRLLRSKPPQTGEGGDVNYLVEICDPCGETTYEINGVTLNDFVTPHYYDAVRRPGVLYSFTGSITRPRQVLNNGYLSWLNPRTNHWKQLTFFGGRRQLRDLGVLGGGEPSRRRGSAHSRTAILTATQSIRVVVLMAAEREEQSKRDIRDLIKRFGPAQQ